MQIVLPGDLATAVAALTAAASSVGWTVERITAELCRLRPAAEAPLEACAFAALAPLGGHSLLTVWPPDGGDERAVEALLRAIEALPPEAGGPGADKLLRRLRRIEGQIRGLQKMVADDRECEAVMTQFAAVSAALKQCAAHLVAAHLVQCVQDELESGSDPTDMLNQRLLRILF